MFMQATINKLKKKITKEGGTCSEETFWHKIEIFQKQLQKKMLTNSTWTLLI